MNAEGFEEISHTADRAMRIWAGDLPSLFAEAAKGLNGLSGVELSEGTKAKKRFETEAPDYESLLVAFLSELIFLAEEENLAFSIFEIRVFEATQGGYRISAAMEGAPIQFIDKAIKAVTYHNLKISRTDRGLEAEIVFDV
jgi:SHS2 domain-containing protein